MAPLSWRPSLSHGPCGAPLWWTAPTKVEVAFVVIQGVVSVGVDGKCCGISVEFSGVGVCGVCGAFRRGRRGSVRHDVSYLFSVWTAVRHHGWSTAAPSSRGLLGILRLGPACGLGSFSQHSRQDHKNSGQQMKTAQWHTDTICDSGYC